MSDVQDSDEAFFTETFSLNSLFVIKTQCIFCFLPSQTMNETVNVYNKKIILQLLYVITELHLLWTVINANTKD